MSTFKRVKHRGQEPIEIFATNEGIHAIDSPVRVKILSMLKQSELPFDEIVARSGKAKSTISVHLNDLINAGVISSRVDSADRRKKIFFINSNYLGGLQKDLIIEDDIRKYFAQSDNSSTGVFDFYRLMFRMIRIELYRQGINIDPILSDAGFHVGQALYEKIGSSDLDTLVDNLGRFWSEHMLGRIFVVKKNPLTIYIYDCFECSELPLLGRPACAFDLGLLKAVFLAHFGEDREVIETECFAMGHDHCCFIIDGKR